MPFEVIAANSAPFFVVNAGEVISEHMTERKALQAALNAAEFCFCEISVTRDYRVKVTYTPADPKTVRLEWTAPTAREDGTPITGADISGYKIKTVTVNGENVATVGNITAAESRLMPGSYRFSVSAIDRQGLASEYSDAVELNF